MATLPYDNQLSNPNMIDEQSGGLDLLGFLRRRKGFVVLLGILGVGIGYMMFQRQAPQYRSDVWVQIIHRNSDVRLQSMLAEKDLTDADFVIRSQKNVVAAVTNHDLTQLTSLRALSMEEATSRISKMLTTKSLSSNVVQISCTGENPGDVREIADAVSTEYVAQQKDNYAVASSDLQALLVKARDEFHDKLSKAEEAYSEFRKTSRLTSDGKNMYAQRADDAYQKVSEIELLKTESKAERDQLEKAISRGGARDAVLLIVGKATTGTAVAPSSVQAISDSVTSARSVSEALFPLLREEAVLSVELGDDHPRLKNLRMQIELTRNHFKELDGISESERQSNQAGAELQEPKSDFLAIYLQSLDEQLKILERKQEDLLTLAKAEEKDARSLMQEEIEDSNKKHEMERLSKLFNETTLHISEIEVSAGMGGVTALVLAPAKHGVLVFPVLSQFLGIAGFLGAFAGLLLGYLVEIADRSFRKPEELIREFGVAIMGHVPFITDARMKTIPEGSIMDRTAVSVHLPRSRTAEAYRAVRTAVCFSSFGGAHRVLQVTSPAAGDGKSTLALNLALSMAQSGKKTILVESDFRRPKVHKLTGVDNKVGFVDVLRGNAELPDAIKVTAVPEFFVLPCGSRPKDPAELLSKPTYEQMLQALRERFDYVIIDSPPVLAVTDPCSVAARVDGVLICMRLSRHTRELGRRTIDQLRDVGATIAGIVVNGVEERDAYGYGNYRYADYRYYYKNYNNGAYGNNDAREYYVDDTPGEGTFFASDSKVDVSA